MNIDEIESLIDMIARADIAELTLKAEGRRITIRKTCVPQQAPGSLADQQAPGTAMMSAPAAVEHPLDNSRWITAQMVGIFHHAEPPVSPGVQVEVGQVVGSIESMKLMNDIRAEVSGIVVESLAEAGTAVEYGQNLFGIEVKDERDERTDAT